MEDDGSQSTEPPSPGDRCNALTIEIIDERRLFEREKCAWIGVSATVALESVAVHGGGVRARIVDDAEMAAAHERWSGVAGVTDVLTFDLGEGGDGALDVDILICIDEARRQALARGLEPEYELLLYVVHGVLHCLGHDDHDDAAAARMHAEEDRLLGLAGVGPVYAVAARAGSGSSPASASVQEHLR